MATNRWLGHAAATYYTVTLTVASTTSGHTFITTINGKSITYTAGAAETTTTIATGIQALLAASVIPEFTEISWTSAAAVVTGTGRIIGRSHTVTKSGTGTYNLSETQATGPSFADNTANWSLGTLPGAGDSVLIDGGPDILYGLNGLSAAAYTIFEVKASFGRGRIGLPYRNTSAGTSNSYVEYRTRYWPMATAVPVEIGEGDGDGPIRVNIDITTAADVTVWKTGQREDPTVPCVNLKGAGSGTVSVIDGDVGLAADDNTAAITVTTGTHGAGILTVGPGATVTTLNHRGGEVLNYGATPTVVQRGGTYRLYGTAATAFTMDPEPDAATVLEWRAGGTIGTLTARGQPGRQPPFIDCSLDPRAKTVTNGTITGGARVNDPDGTVTMSNPLTSDAASLATSDWGQRFTFTRTIS